MRGLVQRILLYSILLMLVTQVGCKKDSTVAIVSTSTVINIDSTSAISGGIIKSDGGETVRFKGVCWSIDENPTIADQRTSDGSGNSSYESRITGLKANTVYYVRAYAVNSEGTAYGKAVAFTTGAEMPIVTTAAVSLVTVNSALAGGDVTSDGGSAITARGVCWSTSSNPTINDFKTDNGTGTGQFSSSISNLTSKTKYYVRSYATNSAGTSYGSELSFTTLADSPVVVDNHNMLLGNPSGAITNEINANNYLMVKPQYSLSYNNSKRTMNWTSWHLYSGDIGSTARQDDFRSDATLPASWYHVTDTDYQYSIYGFDRGHMCPSADRTLTVADNSATFLMTNMIPQAPSNNQQTWGALENYCRTLINSGYELYIIGGPYGQGGTGAKGTFTVLASGVVVPAQTWKIILVLPNGNSDLSRISTTTRVIAVVMPNTQACSANPWKYYRVSIDSLETLTGYNFLSNVSTEIQDVIEARVDNL